MLGLLGADKMIMNSVEGGGGPFEAFIIPNGNPRACSREIWAAACQRALSKGIGCARSLCPVSPGLLHFSRIVSCFYLKTMQEKNKILMWLLRDFQAS